MEFIGIESGFNCLAKLGDGKPVSVGMISEVDAGFVFYPSGLPLKTAQTKALASELSRLNNLRITA